MQDMSASRYTQCGVSCLHTYKVQQGSVTISYNAASFVKESKMRQPSNDAVPRLASPSQAEGMVSQIHKVAWVL